ncbi:MAG: ABC transporter ATP-binding protein [bacterium]
MQESLRNKILTANQVYKKFGQKFALKDINLTIYENEIFGLIGPDGAGKTTFLRILSSVLLPDQGMINILGQDILKNPEAIKDKIGVVPQNFSLYGDLTVEENLSFFSQMYQVEAEEFAKKKSVLLEITNLNPFLNRHAKYLSGGMQKKLALIISMLHKPKLLLLDEPTTGVDPLSRRELWDFFYELLKSKTTIIVSTPYLDEMERCTRVGFLYDGKLILIAEPEKILKKYPNKSFDEIFITLIKKDYEGD